MKKRNATIHKYLCRAAAAVFTAALILALPARVWARDPDPTGITDVLTSETEKEKLREALEELEYRGLTPRRIWEEIWHRAESGELPDAGTLVENAREEAGQLMEDATSEFTQNVEEKVKENFLERILSIFTGKKDEGSGK